jgi:hypothetical protein
MGGSDLRAQPSQAIIRIFPVHIMEMGFICGGLINVSVQKIGKMVRNGKVVSVTDWRNTGHIERVHKSLHHFTRASPSMAAVCGLG